LDQWFRPKGTGGDSPAPLDNKLTLCDFSTLFNMRLASGSWYMSFTNVHDVETYALLDMFVGGAKHLKSYSVGHYDQTFHSRQSLFHESK
jgi:hypothetical protein